MTKKKRSPKPVYYWIYWGASYLFLLLLFGNKIGSGIYSLILLFAGFAERGILILTDANQGLLDSETYRSGVSFSLENAIAVAFLLGVMIVTYAASIFIVAQFILPVLQFDDRMKAARSFAAFNTGTQNVAIFVKEGGKIESHGESDEASGGVVLADLSSAVALSKQKDVHSWNITGGMEDESEEVLNWWKRWKESRRKDNVGNKYKKAEFYVDPIGPGLTFLRKGQRVSGEIDLRPQSRRETVTAYMRNGIQVGADVSVSYSLSAEPEVVCFGEVSVSDKVRELRWLDMDENLPGGWVAIRDTYELDPHDIPILEAYTRGEQGNFSEPEVSPSSPNTPYRFFRERVFNATYSKARSTVTGSPMHWHEAPLDRAVEMFRQELLTIPYDDLYPNLAIGRREDVEMRGQPVDVLKKMKDTFQRKMKLKGEILFQYIQNQERAPFRIGEVYPAKDLVKYSPIRLTYQNFNSLRSVGVVITSAGFSNLQPSNPDIKKRLVANWKARWEKEVEFINAEHELESVRIQNRNRAQIQQEMTHLLASIFQSSHTDEALALRVFQALESAAVNPGSENDITPREIIDMLDSLHRWLLVDRKDLQPDKEDEPGQDARQPRNGRREQEGNHEKNH